MAKLYSNSITCEYAIQLVDALFTRLKLHPDQAIVKPGKIYFESEETWFEEIAELSKILPVTPITYSGTEEFSGISFSYTFENGRVLNGHTHHCAC